MDIRHFLQLKDLSLDELEHIFERTRIIKQRFKAYQTYHPLVDRTLEIVDPDKVEKMLSAGFCSSLMHPDRRTIQS